MAAEDYLDDTVETIVSKRPGYPPYKLFAWQYADGIKPLAGLVGSNSPRSVQELGTGSEGSLYLWSRHLDSASRIVHIDKPKGRFGGEYTKRQATLFR